MRLLALAFLPVLLFAGNEPSDFRRLPAKRGYFGSTQFAYREYQGWALVQGDILLAPLSEIRPTAASPKSSPDKSATTVNAPHRVWPNGVVYYVIDPQMQDTDRILEAMRHWEKSTPIHFQERTNQPVYVTFRPIASGCNANVGATGNLGTVNLSRGCDLTATIHEIGHTLGLWHEQSRIDRDRSLHVRYENIIPQYRDQYDQQILDGADIGPYDFGSIMHYSAFGFSRNEELTMQSRPAGIPIGEAAGISALDIQAIHKLYGFPMRETLISSTPPGLKVVVDGQEHVTPAAFTWADGETHTVSAPDRQRLEDQPGVRYHFAAWSDAEAAEHTITVGTANRVFDARFARHVLVSTGPNVTLSPPSEDGYYVIGSRVRLQAVPEEGLSFTGWSQPDGEDETYDDIYVGAAPNPLDITVLTPLHPYHARFAEGPITTIGNIVPGQLMFIDDELYVTPVRFAWQPGSEHVVEPFLYLGADYSTDFTFVRWPGSDEEILKFTAPEQSTTINPELKQWHSVELDYDWWIYLTDTRPSTIGYRLSPDSDDGYYEAGTQLTVLPPEYYRWKLINWYSDGTGSGPLQLTVNEPRYIVGNFFGFSSLNAGAIVNDASRQPGPISAGERLRVHWNGDMPDAPLTAPLDAQLPTSLGGVQVRIKGDFARLISVSKDEIVCLVPDSVKDVASAALVVVTGRVGTTNVDVPVLSRSPGLYVATGLGQGSAVAHPVTEGDEIELRATGLNAAEPTTLLIDNVEVPVLSAEPAAAAIEPGVWLVRARIPAALVPGRRSIYLLNGGRPSQIGVTLEIAAPAAR